MTTMSTNASMHNATIHGDGNSSEEFSIYNLIRCEFNADDFHIINDPRSLPCGNSACYSCIEKVLYDGSMNCKFCHQVHSVNLRELPKLLPIERAIDTHVVRLTKFLLSKSKDIVNNLQDNFENRESQLRKLFSTVQKDIKKHIETMKSQLDDLQTTLYDTCENIKVQINLDLIELEKLTERLHAEKFIKETNRFLDRNDANIEKLKKNMHSCDYNLKKLKLAHMSYTRTIEKLKFKPNFNWLPQVDDIGTVGMSGDRRNYSQELEDLLDKEDDGKIRQKFKQKSEVNEVNLKFKPYALCELKDGNVAVSAFDKHKLIVLKGDTFAHVKEITGAENIALRYPSGLCTDETKDHVYLCDQYNHRVIVFDASIDSLTNIIKEEFLNPIDACFNSNQLFILDYGNRVVKCFNKDGEFRTQFNLCHGSSSGRLSEQHSSSSFSLNAPRHQTVSNDEIAVTDNFDKIYIYDKFRNSILQTIDADLDSRFMSILFADNYLFLHEIKTESMVNNFICYERFEFEEGSKLLLSNHDDTQATNDAIRYFWKETQRRELDTLKDSVARSYNMAKVGDRFAICLHEKKKIVLI